MGTTYSQQAARTNREFSDYVKRTERDAARDRCRICGRRTRNGQYAHIISCSNNLKRNGTDDVANVTDERIKSWENCLFLCYECHRDVDSTIGLEKYTVSHLMGLKDPLNHGRCRAVADSPRKKKNYRCKANVLEDNYLCLDHRMDF